jgi:hypothetical protein
MMANLTGVTAETKFNEMFKFVDDLTGISLQSPTLLAKGNLIMNEITNYKDHLKTLSKTELIKKIIVSTAMVEKYEVERVGGTHLTDANGPDGLLPCGTHHEIKSQRWEGSFTLRGRGKFGAPSYALHNSKIEADELITIIGYHPVTGQLYYRFNFKFEAIADRYWDAAEKGWGNYDTIPLHYADHHSFSVEYIAARDILLREQHIFQPKFLDYLLSY